jgi:hypothetical protein
MVQEYHSAKRRDPHRASIKMSQEASVGVQTGSECKELLTGLLRREVTQLPRKCHLSWRRVEVPGHSYHCGNRESSVLW